MDDDATTLVNGQPGHDPSTPGTENSARAVEAAVEQVSRDLHTLYKQKHETKVTALKKSYEARWERRVRELQERADRLGQENEELRVGRDATLSGVVVPRTTETEATRSQREADDQLRAEEMRAAHERAEALEGRLARAEADLGKVQRETALLTADLETSRQENGELVAAVEQMLQLESSPRDAAGAPPPVAAATEVPRPASRAGQPKISGLRGPGFGSASGQSRIVTVRSASGTMRSGIMGNIERMGRGRVID